MNLTIRLDDLTPILIFLQMVTHQQRIIMVLQSLGIDTEVLDIAAPGMDEARDFMRGGAKKKENQRNVLPPQIFNGDTYCGVRIRDIFLFTSLIFDRGHVSNGFTALCFYHFG